MDPAFVLTGLVVHELRWQVTLDQIIAFRRRIRDTYGFKLCKELHASKMINQPGPLVRIKRYDRVAILRQHADELAWLPYLNLINLVIDKRNKPLHYAVFASAWRALIQRFENTLLNHNFPGPQNADNRGMILPDNTDDKKLELLLRKMRRYNPIPIQ